MWILVSFSEISAPLAPFEPGYMVGIVENDGGDREIVQVSGPCHPLIGMKGEVKHIENDRGALNIFMPEKS